MESFKSNKCPATHLLEAYITDRLSQQSYKQKITTHLNHCPQCSIAVQELSKFYQIFQDELNHCVSNSVFKLLNQLEHERINHLGILLRPLQPMNGHKSMSFQAELITPSTLNQQLTFDDIRLEKDEILLRAIQSRTTLETTLYLFAHNEKLYRNINFQLKSGGKKFCSDREGKINLGKFNLNLLNKEIITIAWENNQ